MNNDFVSIRGISLPRRMVLQGIASLLGGAFTPGAFAAAAKSCRLTERDILGPFYRFGAPFQTKLAGPNEPGERLIVSGKVYSSDCRSPLPNTLIEIWQANSHGKYAHPEDQQTKPVEPGFQGYGRIGVDENGRFMFTTVKPGAVPGPGGKRQAPHIAVSVFARGLLLRLVTRIYFPEDSGNAGDYVLNLVETARRGTLIARRTAAKDTFEWNVILQGAEETVFFDC